MQRFPRILIDATVLTGGLVMYSGLVFGTFQCFLHPLTIGIPMAIPACLGYWIHRGYWKKLATTLAVVGLSSVLMLLGSTVIGLPFSPPMSLTETIKTALYFFLTSYFAFFWLPFALGAVVGSVVPRLAQPPPLATHIK
jgi:hypothetical protein